jgi:hypothetical protein
LTGIRGVENIAFLLAALQDASAGDKKGADESTFLGDARVDPYTWK